MTPRMRFLVLIVGGALAVCASQAAEKTAAPIRTAQTRWQRPVVSWYELRQQKLVRQTWDSSCGAAALSTLLTHQLGLPVSEYAVAASILRNGDPTRVRERGGFSLLDLKRLVDAIGLVGEGYGDMTVADLVARDSAAIVPIRYRKLDHFVVFRGVLGDRVVLGDPAFGNLTLPMREFATIWQSRIAFYVRRRQATSQTIDPLLVGAQTALPDLPLVGRLLRGAGPVPEIRQLPLVARP
jgi:uncharacterized protein